MKAVPADLLSKLQKRPKYIRNICILAHVDHGKTTLADSLVASNGIISQKMAGKLRYMDSLEEEQIRGITMKSSAISLLFKSSGEHYLVNLIDSPGHIDFSSEVSTAVRLCDGAIVVIDAVEGVSPQTHAVLRQAWLEDIKPVLLINKLDRVISELKMSPMESYLYLQQLLEQVNAVMAQLISGEIHKKSAAETEDSSEPKNAETEELFNWDSGLHADENDDAHLYFSPDSGNVVFGSALDGWAFGIQDFAAMYAQKLGLNEKVLSKTLWGDYYYNPKAKKVLRGAQNAGKKCLFVQMILDNIWKLYNTVNDECRDVAQIEKLVTALNVKLQPRDLNTSDPKALVKTIMSQWLSISKATLTMVAEHTPSPLDIGEDRVESLMCDHSVSFNSLHERTKALKQDFMKCSSDETAPVIVYVSKMAAVEQEMLTDSQQSALTKADLEQRREIARLRHQQKMTEKETLKEQGFDESSAIEEEGTTPNLDDEKPQYSFLAFARIFSGKIKKGQKLYVLGPKHNPAEVVEQDLAENFIDEDLTVDKLSSDLHITQVTVENLYVFMGRELEPMEEIPAGNILGIAGLENHVLKSATLSSDVACTSFSNMLFEAQPIVRVAVEPTNPSDMGKLVQGMKLLNQADPCVQVFVQETGEHVLVAAGEVHLQRCCDDLRKRYAGIPISVSDPIVPFRETIIEPPKVDMVNEAIEGENVVVRNLNQDKGDAVITMTKGSCTLSVEALPLPPAVTKLIDENSKLLQALDQHLTQSLGGHVTKYDRQNSLNEQYIGELSELRKQIETALENSSHQEWKTLAKNIWCFGPRKNGPNILVNSIPGYSRPSIWDMLEVTKGSELKDLDSSVINGFQLATLCGPVCAEPMRGVAIVIRNWEIVSAPVQHPAVAEATQEDVASDTESDSASLVSSSKRSGQTTGVHSGQVISLVKEACIKAFQTQPQRLMCAMYTCNIQATATVLGKVYGVIGKRNGRIISEDMQEGTQIFNIAAVLPVAESFGFSDEIRKKTSGLASPQLSFSHWEVIDVDPFWEPCTEEEMTHYGEKYDSENRAKKYMNQVRRRKGLKVEEKIVMFAEKQRNLGRNK